MKKAKSLFGFDFNLEDERLLNALNKLAAKGLRPEEIAARLGELIPGALAEGAACLLDGLKASARKMLAGRAKLQRGFQARLRKKWGKAFDLLAMLLEASLETGEECNDLIRPAAAAESDFVFDALTRLHARACLIGSEILCLMEGGFASGAMARWRTLHELTVVAYFLEDNGQDVAERYLHHHRVESYRASIPYQEHCKALGQKPFSEKDLAAMKAERDQLCALYGDAYQHDWGWAADALKTKRVNFSEIEEFVSLKHYRPYFKLACYSNHAGSKGIRFDLGTTLVPTGAEFLLAGPSDAGLCDPGNCMAISLLQITTTLLFHRDVTLTSMLTAEALKQLTEEAKEALGDAEAKLAAETGKHHRRLTRRSHKP